MEEQINPNRLWLENIVWRLKKLETPMQEDQILNIVQSILDKYTENESLPDEEQIPYPVFEKLVELLEQKLSSHPSEHLLAALKALPENPVIVDPLIRQQQNLLLDSYDAVLRNNSADIDTLMRRARLYVETHDWEKALADATRVIEIDPQNKDASIIYIRGLLAQEDYVAAFHQVNELLSSDPDHVLALRERALLYQRFNYRELALADATRLASVSNDLADLLFCASLCSTEHDLDEAIRLSRQVLARMPDHAEALFILGKAYLEKGDYEESLHVFEQYLHAVAPFVYLSRQFWERLSAMKFMVDAKYGLNLYVEALNGYLEVMALGVTDYSIKRNYVKVTEHILHNKDREIEREYLTRIREADDSSEPLKAYAEWLGSRGDARGDFIMLQNEFPLPPEALPALDKAENVEKKVEHLWVEANMRAEFARGLPWKVHINNISAPPYLERLPWVHTVQYLEIAELDYDHRPAISTLFEQDLPSLRGLKVHATFFGYSCTQKLVQASFFGNLYSLVLDQCSLDAPSIELIIESLSPSIKELRMLHGSAQPELPIRSKLGDLFLSSPSLQQLTMLDLTDCSLKKEELTKILSSQLPSLKYLVLAGNDLSEFDPDEFLALPVMRQIEALFIGETNLEKRLLPAILNNAHNLSLERLGAQGVWTPDEISSIESHPNFKQIATIEFGMDSLREEDWMKLFD